MKRRLILILILAVALAIAGCASSSPKEGYGSTMSSYSSNDMADSYDGGESAPMAGNAREIAFSEEQGISQPPSAPASLGRKIIMDGSAEMETIAFEETINGLYEMVTGMEGFVESQSIQTGGYYSTSLRYAQVVIRVPSARFDEAMSGLAGLGTVVRKDSNGTDITDQYADTESRVRNLKVQETRILELISKAEKLEEIVILEGRLSDLRYQIESYENALKNYDRLLEYSRITLNISEVRRETDVKPVARTLSERMTQAFDQAWTGFVDDVQDFAVWTVANVFNLLVILALLLILLIVIRVHRRGKRRRLQRQAEEGSLPRKRRGKTVQEPMTPPAQQPPAPPYSQASAPQSPLGQQQTDSTPQIPGQEQMPTDGDNSDIKE